VSNDNRMKVLICVRCAGLLKEITSFLDEDILYSLERNECVCCRDHESLFINLEVTLL
jgi:hypothetical protein